MPFFPESLSLEGHRNILREELGRLSIQLLLSNRGEKKKGNPSRDGENEGE